MTKKVMKLVDKTTGLMECKVCGDYHAAMVKPDSNGAFYRSAWQCRHKCQLPEKGELRAWNGWSESYIVSNA